MMSNDSATLPGAVDIVVVGAGPAGLMAGIAAAAAGRSVLVLEKMHRPGLKLLASGGGRCNLTNTQSLEAFLQAFGRTGRFCQGALEALSSDALREWLAQRGVPTVAEPNGLVFPRSGRASDVHQALLRELESSGGRLVLGCQVGRLLVQGGRIVGVETDQGSVAAGAVVIATGGQGYPELGGTAAGYELAAQAGHSIATPTPALVALVTQEAWSRRCAGIGLEQARIWIDLPRQSKTGESGPVLFTHHGLSGPAVLNLSGQVAALLAERPSVPVKLALLGEHPESYWISQFDLWQRKHGAKAVTTMLAMRLPERLARQLVQAAGIDPLVPAAHVALPLRQALAGLLSASSLTVTATEGFAQAMLTRGGVNLREVDAKTLASRKAKGLFLAGEALDVQGPTGGYNLQWAFSSGYLAGLSAARM